MTIVPANTPYPGLDVQSQPRANPQAYLAPAILVCEGKTEVGLVRGLDDYWVSKGHLPFSSAGVVPVSGGGVDKAPVIAGYFRALGYRVGLLLDSDCEPEDAKILNELTSADVTIFRWAPGHATEDHLFRDLPTDAVAALIKAAATIQDSDQSFLDRLSSKYSERRFKSVAEIQKAADDPELRVAMGELTKSKGKPGERGWFKDISHAEWIGRKHLGPHLDELKGKFPETIAEIRAWVNREQ